MTRKITNTCSHTLFMFFLSFISLKLVSLMFDVSVEKVIIILFTYALTSTFTSASRNSLFFNMVNCSIRPLGGLYEQFTMYKNVNKILMNQCLNVYKVKYNEQPWLFQPKIFSKIKGNSGTLPNYIVINFL